MRWGSELRIFVWRGSHHPHPERLSYVYGFKRWSGQFCWQLPCSRVFGLPGLAGSCGTGMRRPRNSCGHAEPQPSLRAVAPPCIRVPRRAVCACISSCRTEQVPAALE